ncbi:MAG TPA: hypothetical protein DEF72_02325 [Gammaproteobacteria bacterium]|nr:hypothetical protein [Gammaproteobacteria bacterium]
MIKTDGNCSQIKYRLYSKSRDAVLKESFVFACDPRTLKDQTVATVFAEPVDAKLGILLNS